MTKMSLKVTVITYATPQLEKIPKLTASPFLGSPYSSAIFPSPHPLSLDF